MSDRKKIKKQGGRYARNRGHGFERKIAKMLRDIYPGACRQLEYQENNCNGIDLANTGDLRIQCKRSKSSVPMNKIEEIKDPTGIHCLVSKVDRKETLITLKFSDFIEILKASSMRQ